MKKRFYLSLLFIYALLTGDWTWIILDYVHERRQERGL